MNNSAYCPVCRETEYKNADGKPVCKKCGRTASEKEIASDIKSRFEELKSPNIVCPKVYKMNDYEWYASNLSPEKTLKFYLKEMGIEPEDTYPVEDIAECDLDKEGMYIPLEDTNRTKQLENLGVTEQLVIDMETGYKYGIGTVRKHEGDWYIKVTFRDALEYMGFGENSEPFCLCSTES